MAHPVPTKGFLQLSPRRGSHAVCTLQVHPPPPVPPFLLAQNLSPKDIAEVTSRAESCMTHICIYRI